MMIPASFEPHSFSSGWFAGYETGASTPNDNIGLVALSESFGEVQMSLDPWNECGNPSKLTA